MLTKSSSAISALERPRPASASTSRSRSVSTARAVVVDGPGPLGARREVRDQLAGDPGRQERLALGDHRMACEQVGRLRVLEQEPAGAGSQRLEHVLVEVERREHQHPGARAGGVVGDASGGLDPVHVGHADVHQHDVGVVAGGQVDGLAAGGGLTHDLDAGIVLEEHGEAAPYECLIVGDEHADHRAAASVGVRQLGRHSEAAPGRGPVDERASVELDALAHARPGRDRRRCDPSPDAAPRPSSVISSSIVVGAVADLHLRRGPARRASPRWSAPPGRCGRRPGRGPSGSATRSPSIVTCTSTPVLSTELTSDPRSSSDGRRGEVGRRPVVLGPQHAEQAAHLVERLPAGGVDRLEHRPGLVGALVDHVGRDARLHRHDAHRVGDDVVQLAGDAQPFLGHGPLGISVALPRRPRRLGARAARCRPAGPARSDRWRRRSRTRPGW